MSEEGWKTALAGNLTRLRKKHNYTQSSLGEVLSYSDKSISKWERGEGVPDVSVLVRLADLYGVSVDELLGRKTAESGEVKKPVKWYMTLLSNVSSIVLMSALVIYLALTLLLPDFSHSWLTFMAGLPVLFAALGICFIIWKKQPLAFAAFSAALWTCCVFVHLAFSPNVRVLYTVGGILQFAAIIFYASRILSIERGKQKK